MRPGPGKDTGSREPHHPSGPLLVPSVLNSRFQRRCARLLPSTLQSGGVQRRRRFLGPRARSRVLVPPAKHRAPCSLWVPANLQEPPGDLVAPAPTQPQLPGWGPLGPPSGRGALTCPEACGSWPADRAGCRARESPAPIAVLRLLGPLNPRAAGRERPCARPRASGPPGLVRGARAGASTRAVASRRGAAARRLRARRSREWVGRGRRRCPCSPGPALAPPPPGGAPAAATHRPPGPRGRKREI